MRFILIWIVAAALTGCLTTYEGKNNEESCAAAGMYYSGFTVTHTDDRGVDRGSLQCVKPTDGDQECEVEKHREVMREKIEYNNRWAQENVFIGIGYAAYFFPGLLLKMYYQDDADADLEATNKRIVEIRESYCEDDTVAH